MNDIPMAESTTSQYDSWVRSEVLASASQVVAATVDPLTHPDVVDAKMSRLVEWGEWYLRTGQRMTVKKETET